LCMGRRALLPHYPPASCGAKLGLCFPSPAREPILAGIELSSFSEPLLAVVGRKCPDLPFTCHKRGTLAISRNSVWRNTLRQYHRLLRMLENRTMVRSCQKQTVNHSTGQLKTHRCHGRGCERFLDDVLPSGIIGPNRGVCMEEMSANIVGYVLERLWSFVFSDEAIRSSQPSSLTPVALPYTSLTPWDLPRKVHCGCRGGSRGVLGVMRMGAPFRRGLPSDASAPPTRACCAATCGTCGGRGCEMRPGGPRQCCQRAADLARANLSCSLHEPPCLASHQHVAA